MVNGKRVSSKRKAQQIAEDSTSTEEETPSIAVKEIRKSTTPKTRSKSSNNKNKPYKSGFHTITELVNKNFEEDEKLRKVNTNKAWFIEFQLDKQKESPFWPVVDIFVHKKDEKKEEKKAEKRDVWHKNPDLILKIVRQFRHDNSRENAFVFNTVKKKNLVEVKSMPEDLFLIFGLDMVASEPEEGKATKSQAERTYGPLITRIALKDPTKLRKLDAEKEILRIMKEKPKLQREIERNAEDLYWFAEYKKSMTPSSEQGFPRLLRWIISDISNTIGRDLNEAMKRVIFNLCVDTLQEIISFTKELKRKEYGSETDKNEEEEGDGEDDDEEEDGKGGDVDDDDDDGEEEGGKGGDVDDDDEEEGEGGKGGDEEDGSESDKNKVPPEIPEKPSTPPSKINEEEDEKDGTSREVV
ncbi:glutamic acid-rich protein-like [Papaver somniferum]|uniref:glutamic acid-rich protein-like n=1 Tax=Papaver somniferum TaxID=3469 RepID=UPI000E7010EC|nr:glutamic acid-rich protein-like [Papaver somniferum]